MRSSSLTVDIELFNDNCLSCEWCKKGFETSCEEKSMYGLMQDGTFQEYRTIRGIDAIKIDPNTDLASAAPVLCAVISLSFSKCSMLSGSNCLQGFKRV